MTFPANINWLQRLKRPYVFEGERWRWWRLSFFSGLFIFVFLYIFRPFGLQLLHKDLLPLTAGYGMVTFLVMAGLNIGVVSLFPAYFNEQGWTVGREVGWNLTNILLIGLANTVYSVFAGLIDWSWANLLLFEAFTLVVGFFPVSMMVLMKEARLYRTFQKESEAITENIAHGHPPRDLKEGLLTIVSENGKDLLNIHTGQLLFIRAAENYIEIVYLEDSVRQRKVMRNTLRSVENELAHVPGLFRCHKSYLVNLNRVTRVSGNAQGYRLHLGSEPETVPVSRNLNAQIRERFPA